jgi:tetratricopeptide (TPR) repeat protein
MARELQRDPHNLVPESGVPRLDLVLGIADALEWPVEMVIEDLCSDSVPERPESDSRERAPAELLESARTLANSGSFQAAIELAGRVVNGEFADVDRAYALHVQAMAWEGLGRFSQSLAAAQRGVRHAAQYELLELFLRFSMANAHYALGNFVEAEGVATAIITELTGLERSDRRRHILANALYVRGSVLRARASTAVTKRDVLAGRAIEDLSSAIDIFEDHEAWKGTPVHEATAHICRGALLELETLLGRVAADDAVALCLAELERPTPAPPVAMRWSESIGWWCIFACNLAMRHIRDEAALERALAIFTNKADEVAAATGNWALREQVWTIEHTRRRLRESASDEPWVLDAEDIRVLTGAMGRFPIFRETGWQVLRSAREQKEHSE